MPTEAEIIAQERKALMKLMDTQPHFIPRREVDENIVIATWNIAQFSNKKTNRALQYIADICERFDIIAIQEVKSDLGGLARLQDMLPGNYKILVSDTTGNFERMAFLYDKRTVISTGLVCEIGFSGTIEVPTVFQFNRMPYCASFRAGRFDFILVSVHIAEGSSHGETGLALREKEIDELVKFVKARSKEEAAKSFDPDIFVMGDFNIQVFGDRFFKALTKGPEPKFKMPADMDSLGTNFGQNKTFDKIAWVPNDSFKFKNKIGVVPFGKVLYKESGQPADAARQAISDHLPLWAEFRVNELTQQLDQIINKGNG
jgi:exonuclease III